jgi:hypothetical protein
MEYLELLFAVVSQQSVNLIFCWRSFNREDSGTSHGRCGECARRILLRHVEASLAGDFVHPGEEKYSLQGGRKLS